MLASSAQSSLDFRVLGPLQVLTGGQQLMITACKHRTLVASLLVRAGELVSNDELIERLWGDELPVRPRAALQTRITRVRQMLNRGRPGLGDLIVSQPGGYLLDVDRTWVDLYRFRELVRPAVGEDPVTEAGRLGQALALVRGRPLCDVWCPSLGLDVIPRLEEELLLARERWCELEIGLGRHRELVVDLRSLIGQYPFRERFWMQLMTCLYHSGRQTEALQAYCEIDARLRAEVGVDPCAELRSLHTSILRNDG